METTVLIAAVLIAGLSCPAMMWWQRRRGREGGCHPPTAERSDGAAELRELERSQVMLSTRLAELRGDGPETTTAP